MKSCLAGILLILVVSSCSSRAGEAQVAELIAVSREVREPKVGWGGSWREVGADYEKQFLELGEEVARSGELAIDSLDPNILEDRFRLIAFDFLSHRKRYSEVYDKYVRHLTPEEIEEKRKEMTKKARELGKWFDESGILTRVDPTIPAPDSVEDRYLTPDSQYCLEYFWMAPKKEKAMKSFRETFARALDKLKEQNGGKPDIRDLL